VYGKPNILEICCHLSPSIVINWKVAYISCCIYHLYWLQRNIIQVPCFM
jgi:hypothetical protein